MKLIFAGTPEFSAIILNALINTSHEIVAVYTQPDRPAGRGRKLQESPVKQLALKHQFPVFQPEKLKSPIELQAEIMIVAAYGLILPSFILESFKHGCINVHSSLLPRWRGAAPIQRAIIAGDKETGVTIMQMEKGLDTGPMLYKSHCAIESQDNANSLHDKLAALGAKALLHVLENLSAFPPEKQDEALATYASKITKEEKTLNFEKSAFELECAVRGYYPAQAYLNGELIKVWEAIGIAGSSNALPGTILSSTPEGIEVATGKEILKILSLQLPGGRKLSVKEILNAKGHLFSSGNQFCCYPSKEG
jgi:methionyl-tRNA formyltransferase